MKDEQKRKHAARCKKWAKNNPEKIKQHREKHKEKAKQSSKIWRDKNPEKVKEYSRKYAKENPEKIRAQNLIKSRKIPLKNSCEDCGTSERLEHHHPDYSKPLITETLCKPCHININKGVKYK